MISESRSIFDEVTRIGHRQFEWQVGFENLPNFYRSAYLFGGPHASKFFLRNHQIELPTFVMAGVAIAGAFKTAPLVSGGIADPKLGLTSEVMQSAWRLLALPIDQARTETRKLRANSISSVAYRPSILRRFPCISFASGSRIRAPLLDLIFARITTGLYYDVVGAGGDVTREIGDRFESYSLSLLKENFGDAEWREAEPYKVGKNLKETPDITLHVDGQCTLVVECKAKKMTIAARYGEEPLTDAKAGFAEISKGIFQIWKYVSHARQGLVPKHELSASVIGTVLTLDPWLTMSRHRKEVLLTTASKLADDDGDILPIDRIAITIVSVEDLERVLSKATLTSFLRALSEFSKEGRSGYHLSSIHDELSPSSAPRKKYPFRHRMTEVLPWLPTQKLDG